LEHFFSSLLSSVGFWAAVLGGGFILAGRQMANRAHEGAIRNRKRRAVNGTLQSIATELKVLKANCLDPLENRLRDLAKYREDARRNRLNDPPPLAMTRTEPRCVD
jgi:hypothetical protein